MVMSPHIRHSAKGTTWSKADAKYVRKIKVNGKWRYFYKDAFSPYVGDDDLYGDRKDDFRGATDQTGIYKDGYGNEIRVSSKMDAVTLFVDRCIHNNGMVRMNEFKWTLSEGRNRGRVEAFVSDRSLTLVSHMVHPLLLTNSAIGKKRKDRGH